MDEFRPDATRAGKRARRSGRRSLRSTAVPVCRRRCDSGRRRANRRHGLGASSRCTKSIKAYTNRTGGTLPGDAAMLAFGTDLFETLIQGDVRRLYDEARARQRTRRLDLVLTSMIPWICRKALGVCLRRGARKVPGHGRIHFVRNVLTNVPADPIVRRDGPLRILVVAAQPVGFGRLSIEQEVDGDPPRLPAADRRGLSRS